MLAQCKPLGRYNRANRFYKPAKASLNGNLTPTFKLICLAGPENESTV